MTILDTARVVLAAAPAKDTNMFGSYGELKHTLAVAEKFGGALNERGVVSSLARIARQRGLTTGDAPFVWSERELTHKIDTDALRSMCDALVASFQGE